MKKHNLLVAIVAVVECIAFTAQPVQAAKYSKSEAKQVKYFQRKYKNLDKAQYNRNSIYLYGIGTGDGEIVTVALSQIGNVGGEPYWSWYGFNSRVEWCACFVSW